MNAHSRFFSKQSHLQSVIYNTNTRSLNTAPARAMAAATTICRSFIFSNNPFSCRLSKRLLCLPRLQFHASPPAAKTLSYTFPTLTRYDFAKQRTLSLIVIPSNRYCARLFSSSEAKTNQSSTKTNFLLSDSDSDEEENQNQNQKKKEIDKSKLPPPYDPFNKKPVIEEPKDPTNLQEVFHNMRSDGLMQNAVKMFDALSKDGLTHEAMELFAQIKDKGNIPDVIAHTAVIEAYAKAGQSKEALKVYMRMLASGVVPNAYTYTVLIKGLAADGKLGDAKKYVVEMMGKGMRPNAGTYTAVFEAFVRERKEDEGREFLEQIKAKGFVPDEKGVREVLNNKRGQVSRTVMNILFGK